MINILTFIGKFSAIDVKKIPRNEVVAILDSESLHKFIINKVANELQFLSEDCYYPRVADIFKELLNRCQTTEEKLLQYSKHKYTEKKWHQKARLLHDPQTTLLIIIIQEFLSNKDYAGAIATINLLSLRFYSNKMHDYIKFCNPDYFRTAMNRLSHNHLFSQKKTIGNAILYLAGEILKNFKTALEKDDTQYVIAMIFQLRGRIAQSSRSLAGKYYEASEDKGVTRIEKEDLPEKQTIDKKIRTTSNKIAKEIVIYNLIDNDALDIAQKITKQNSKLAKEYVKNLPNVKFAEQIELAIYFFLKEVEESKAGSKNDYMEVSKRLMSIKVTNKPIYYKQLMVKIHDQIVNDLGYMQYFDRLSIQSKGISRRFISLYLGILIFNFLNT
jgi:hypothetical protein